MCGVGCFCFACQRREHNRSTTHSEMHGRELCVWSNSYLVNVNTCPRVLLLFRFSNRQSCAIPDATSPGSPRVSCVPTHCYTVHLYTRLIVFDCSHNFSTQRSIDRPVRCPHQHVWMSGSLVRGFSAPYCQHQNDYGVFGVTTCSDLNTVSARSAKSNRACLVAEAEPTITLWTRPQTTMLLNDRPRS